METVCSTKEKHLTTNQALASRDGRFFGKKRVMVKAGIPPCISEDTVYRVLGKTDLKQTHFKKKGNLTQNQLKLRLEVAREVCFKRANVQL